MNVTERKYQQKEAERMSSQTSKSKKNSKKFPMDSEVTRVVLIFLLLLVIIVLLVAAFMSLGHGAENTNTGNVYHIEAPAEEDPTAATEPIVTTTDPNHGNTETEPIPAEVLDPSLATTESVTYIETSLDIAPETDENGETIAMPETTGVVYTAASPYTTTGARPDSPTPVYVATTDPYAGIATLAPPLTTAGGSNGNTTVTTTVQENTPGDGTISNTNYVIALSGSAGIYSSPNGSSNGTIGSAGSFTIVQEMTDTAGVKWGKLKSGAGWVRLN